MPGSDKCLPTYNGDVILEVGRAKNGFRQFAGNHSVAWQQATADADVRTATETG